MANIKDLKDRKKQSQTEMSLGDHDEKSAGQRQKRRPGRAEPEASDADVQVVDVEHGVFDESAGEDLHAGHLRQEKTSHHDQETSATHSEHENQTDETSYEEDKDKPRVELHFFGSELVRSRFPKSFALAEAVATDWAYDGQFDHLPIQNPLAQFAAQKGLLQAKQVEKKVVESPVTEKVATQIFTYGLKAQGMIEQLRSKLAKKDKNVD